MPKLNQKGVVHILAILVMLVGMVATLYLISHPAIFKPKASNEFDPAKVVTANGKNCQNNGGNLVCEVDANGDVELKFNVQELNSR